VEVGGPFLFVGGGKEGWVPGLNGLKKRWVFNPNKMPNLFQKITAHKVLFKYFSIAIIDS